MLSKVTAGAVLALVVFAAPAEAKQKPITGKLSKRGYTVIALADNGRAATAKGPKFRLVPPAKTVTLHLRDARGSYAGPVVVGGKGSKVVVGVKAGASLGNVRVLHGYARATVAGRYLYAKRTARARKGAPIGANRLGLVKTSASGRGGLGRDQDLDGIPGAFDVDDDGDLVLDNVEAGARAANHTTAFPDSLHPWWVINAGLEVSFILEDRGITHGAAGYALNINAAGPFAGDANFKALQDTVMKDRGSLLFGSPDANAELDCGGLSYCRAGGSGMSHTRQQKYPEQFDPDEDGLGSMPPLTPGEITEGQDGLDTFSAFSASQVFGIAPLAGDGEIRSGDTFVRHASDGAEYPVVLNTVFETVPALARWSDGTTTQDINYPVLRGGPGSEGTPFEMQPNSAGDYVLRLTTWKPQRRPVTPEEGTGWLDQGGLVYTVVGKTVEQNRRVFSCPDALVNDASVDSPTDPANTAEVPVNLTACLRNALGIDWAAQPVPVDLFVGAHSIYGDVAEGGGFAFKPKTAGASADQFTGTWRFPGGTAGTTIEWTVTANSAETGHFGIIAYSPRAVTGGTTPAGWTCHLGQAGPDADWDCTGGRLTPGQSVSGQVTLSQNGEDNMALSLLVCDDSNVCKGFGMTQQK